jgi:dCMP deaminase
MREIGEFKDYRPPSWDRLFMRLVYEYASKSKDPSSKIGAVVVRDRRPILFGYNGFPEGVEDTQERLLNRELKLPFTEHAERNVIDMAAAFGISSAGGTLYTQILPCSGCAKAIMQAKIVEVVVHRPADEYFKTCFTGGTWAKEHEFTRIMFSEKKMKVRYIEETIGCMGYFGGKMIEL